MRIAACRGDDPLEKSPSDLVPNWMTEGVWEVEHIVYPLFNKAWAIKQVPLTAYACSMSQLIFL